VFGYKVAADFSQSTHNEVSPTVADLKPFVKTV
jgi:hypothetical protein